MVAPPSPAPLSRLLGSFFKVRFGVIGDRIRKANARKLQLAQRPVELLTENEGASLTLLFCLRNATGQAIEYGRR